MYAQQKEKRSKKEKTNTHTDTYTKDTLHATEIVVQQCCRIAIQWRIVTRYKALFFFISVF